MVYNKDLEDTTKEHLDRIYIYNEKDALTMTWSVFPGTTQMRSEFRDGILRIDVFIEAVRHILGLPNHILQPFADGHDLIGRNTTMVSW